MAGSCEDGGELAYTIRSGETVDQFCKYYLIKKESAH
jgi:hypothetical protein